MKVCDGKEGDDGGVEPVLADIRVYYYEVANLLKRDSGGLRKRDSGQAGPSCNHIDESGFITSGRPEKSAWRARHSSCPTWVNG